MNNTAKEMMLARIRGAVAHAPEAPPIPQDFRQQDQRERAAILEELVDRLIDYKARVTHVGEGELVQVLTSACQEYGVTRLVVPPDLPDNWLPLEVSVLKDDPPIALADLEQSSGVLTGCSLAIAQTGTIILDGGAAQGRRALSLVPDLHLCVVRAEQVVGLVPEAVALLEERATRPITLISGPSATSDIELNRVEGVHGPRTLHVFLVK